MKTLTLLFLSLLCTCVSAQKIASPEVRGSGSMIVNIGDEIWEVSISSETLHETHQFVSENRYRENPRGLVAYFYSRNQKIQAQKPDSQRILLVRAKQTNLVWVS